MRIASEPTQVDEAELDALYAEARAICQGKRDPRPRPVDWINSSGTWTRTAAGLVATGAAQEQVLAIDVTDAPLTMKATAIARAKQGTSTPFLVELVSVDYLAGTHTMLVGALSSDVSRWHSFLLGAIATLTANHGLALRVTSAAAGDKFGGGLVLLEVP